MWQHPRYRSAKEGNISRKAAHGVLTGLFVGTTLASVALGAVGVTGAAATTAKTTTKPATKAAKPATSAAATKYLACLKAHGVTITFATHKPGTPRPSGATGTRHLPPGVNATTFAKAQTACASLKPAGFGGGAFNSQAFAAYRNCLKLNGVTLPTGASGTSTHGVLNTSNPKVAAAVKACAALKPHGPSGTKA